MPRDPEFPISSRYSFHPSPEARLAARAFDLSHKIFIQHGRPPSFAEYRDEFQKAVQSEILYAKYAEAARLKSTERMRQIEREMDELR